MPLKIIRAEDPIIIETVTLQMSGPPGVGKSSLANSAENPLTLDFDLGAHRAVGRKDTVRIGSWAEVANISTEDLAGYKTLVIDTAGRALDFLSRAIIDADNKMRNKNGGLTLPGYGALRTQFSAWMATIRNAGLDVILVVHSTETQDGDTVRERIDVTGGSKGEIYRMADTMGYVYMEGSRRMVGWDPTDGRFGKNPLGALLTAPIPDIDDNPHYLADCIKTTKDAINQMNQAQVVEAQRVKELRAIFAGFTTPETFTDQSLDMGDSKRADKRMLVDVARERGFSYDANLKVFVVDDAPVAAPEQAEVPSEPAPAEEPVEPAPVDTAPAPEPEPTPEPEPEAPPVKAPATRKKREKCEEHNVAWGTVGDGQIGHPVKNGDQVEWCLKDAVAPAQTEAPEEFAESSSTFADQVNAYRKFLTGCDVPTLGTEYINMFDKPIHQGAVVDRAKELGYVWNEEAQDFWVADVEPKQEAFL